LIKINGFEQGIGMLEDDLRICQKCRAKVKFDGEDRRKCPACGATVWFFHFKRPPELPPEPVQIVTSPWRSNASRVLLGTMAVLAFIAFLAFMNTLIVVMVSVLIAFGFGIFAFIRHAETTQIEDQLVYIQETRQYASLVQKRTEELVQRYIHLLRTGNERIEHYREKFYETGLELRESAAEMMRDAERERQAIATVEEGIFDMADRLVNDNLKWVAQKLRADPENYQRQKKALTKTFDFVESVGHQLDPKTRKKSLVDLKKRYSEKVREKTLKDEQRRIKQQMREEERVRREREAAIKEAEQRERELQARIQEALDAQGGEMGDEIEELQRQLREAQENAERTKSMAQLTKAGHVYVLSNIGSFGENIYKVGMTRRLEPLDRVKELGDASVPFSFDVHAMVSCDNAPGLEKALHHELTRYRVNRINLRKEYFSIDLEEIFKAVEKHHGKVEYVAEPEALEYRESIEIDPNELVELEEELVELGVNVEDDEDD